MKKLTVLVDMDGIAVDFVGGLLLRYNFEFGRNVTKADITDWDLHKCVPDGNAIYKYFDDPDLFSDLAPIPGALRALRRLLYAEHDVYFLSAASKFAMKGKEVWVEKYAPFMLDRMIITRGKTPKFPVRGDVLIDDGAHNLIAYREKHPDAFLTGIEYPYTAPGVGAADVLYDYRDTERAWNLITRDIGLLAEGNL